MVRDMDRFNASVEKHKEWQLDYFNKTKQRLIDKAIFWRDKKGDLEKWNDLLTEAEKMKFQFDKKECLISYGFCTKPNAKKLIKTHLNLKLYKFNLPLVKSNELKKIKLKKISFIPNVCQLHTQHCFVNRKQI